MPYVEPIQDSTVTILLTAITRWSPVNTTMAMAIHAKMESRLTALTIIGPLIDGVIVLEIGSPMKAAKVNPPTNNDAPNK